MLSSVNVQTSSLPMPIIQLLRDTRQPEIRPWRFGVELRLDKPEKQQRNRDFIVLGQTFSKKSFRNTILLGQIFWNNF